jgi:cytochrome c-type biogenesis protein CcmH/NrfG
MKNKMALMVLVLFFAFGLIDSLCAQTAGEFEQQGLDHFRKAFYEAVPQKDNTRAQAEYGKAEKAFREAIRKKPGRVEPYLHLGRTYFVQKKYQKAGEVYREAITLAPERKPIYLKLASALEMQGDYAGAIGVLKQLRDRETDERAIQILDGFIAEMEKKM